jgi:hypothetical protein
MKTWMMVHSFWGNAVTMILHSLLYSELQGIPLQLQLLYGIPFPHTSPVMLAKSTGKINLLESLLLRYCVTTDTTIMRLVDYHCVITIQVTYAKN